MAHITPSSAINISPIPGVPLTTKKSNLLTRCSIPRRVTRQILPAQKYNVPLSTSIRLFPHFRIGCGLKPKQRTTITFASGASAGTDVAVDETNVSTEDDEAPVAEPDVAEANGESSAKTDAGPVKSKRPRPGRKSEMPPVKNEDLIPGATFTGKVRSIQPFGAFVDFGAFTDGLVHVSRLSDSFVRDVGNVVTVGQEVTVRLIEANMETGRISLSMRESDDPTRVQQQPRDSQVNSGDKSRPPRKTGPKSNQRREDSKKTSKFVRGQDLEGTVKNTTRSGAFISLPEGEEGFLPTSEEADEGFGNMMGGSSLEVGQEVSVRVLRITRGQVTLTMKKEEDVSELDAKLNQGITHTATNPFVVAFRSNKDISEYLDKRENEKGVNGTEAVVSTVDAALNETMDEKEVVETVQEDSKASLVVEEVVEEAEEKADDNAIIKDETQIEIPDMAPSSVSMGPLSPTESQTELAAADQASSNIVEDEICEAIVKDEVQIDIPDEAPSSVSDGPLSPTESESEPAAADQALSNIVEEEVSEANLEAKEIQPEFEGKSVGDPIVEDEPQIQPLDSAISLAEQGVPEGSEDILSTTENDKEELQLSSELTDQTLPPIVEEVAPKPGDEIVEKDVNSTEPSVAQSEEVVAAENVGIERASEQSGLSDPETNSIKSLVNEEAGNKLENGTVKEEAVQTTPAAQQNGNLSNPSEQSDEASPKETATKAAISPALVKQLREETGAGMMDCKRALSESEGDIVKAQEYLRKKGLASADMKASRATAEGRIGSYIHDSRIGVLIEVNCETDFVARGEIFRELVEDLAMQVAACPQVQYLSTEDVPTEIVDKEKEIEMQKEDLQSKPEQFRAKIIEGRVRKRLEELVLLEQPFIKDDKVVVKDWVKQTISTIGENIKVKRFARYNLGEGLEKKSQDFAAEVAAQTTAKPVSASKEQEPAATDTEKPVESPKAVISAALVKQLREETGAGMMDCKKALSETGGDLEKAQEYLRKKGLSTADKKSSRLAAEGRIGSYIHDSRIGVMIEVNCETDFVGRGQIFKELVDNLAMQVTACPQVQYVSIEDIPEDIVSKEKELELQREDILSKPENIREKIVEGRVNKRLGEIALLEQPFNRDDALLVKDLVKQTIAGLGENIKVRRFVRFTLGEESGNA